jgi:hypothetical protein
MPEPRRLQSRSSQGPAPRAAYTPMPPERPKRCQSQPRLHWTDRLICAACGGFLGLVTAAIFFMIALYRGAIDGRGAVTFGRIWIAAGLAAVLSAAAGPERMMDAFTWIWDRPRAFRSLFRWRD